MIVNFEETKQKVELLKPIDDAFFQKLMENKEVCQEMLRVILCDDFLEVKEVVPQDTIKNLRGRSVILDAYCIMGDGRSANIEVQKSDNDNHLKRVRYNASCITANITEPGERFEKVPNVTVVYISRFDMFNLGRTIYHVEPTIIEVGGAVDNGLHEVYVNTKVDDGSTIAELMKCMEQEIVDNDKFPKLSQEVRYYKKDRKGVEAMCKAFEDYVDKKLADVVINAFDMGISLEDISKLVSKPIDFVKNVIAQLPTKA